MPQELGLPKYFKYSECKPGQKLVTMGEFIGTTQGKFGDLYNFLELATGTQVVLNKTGQIAWRIEQGHIAEGGVYDVTFEGKEKLTQGKFAGKEANKFKFAKYDDGEIAEAGYRRSGAVAKAPTPTPTPQEISAPVPVEAMDDLD